MNPSDFLTIMAISVAVWAIIPKKERNFIQLFFSPFEIVVLVLSLLFIHYLMAFDWILENWASGLSIFTVDRGINAKIWAYILALVVIALLVLNVSFGYFSRSRLDKLITLYKSLLKENEIDLLVSYVQKYHIVDIKKYLIGLSQLPEEEDIDIRLRSRTDSDKAYEKLIKPKRLRFAAYVCGNIFQNELFVRIAASKYPELFATAFKGMETPKAAKEELVKLYIECLFESKNQSLIQELKIANDSSSSLLDRAASIDLPILSGVLVNTPVAFRNGVWYPVGQGVLKSLRYDEDQKDFLKNDYDHELEPELWNYKIWIAIVYFNYMVRETIYRDSGWHMWLFYFRHITDRIIENIPEENDYDSESEHPSFNHYILYELFSIMIGWIDLSKELNNDNRVIDTVRCLGWCVHSICQADKRKLSNDFKKRQLARLVSLYCEYGYFHENIACKTTREMLKKLFLNPKGVDSGIPNITPEYLSLMKEVWRKFDRIPFTTHSNSNILEEFEEHILVPLEIHN